MVAGVFVGACAGTMAPPSGTTAATAAPTPIAATPEPATPSASTSPDASAAAPVNLGDVGVTPRGSRVTVHSFGPSDRSPAPPTGSEWLEADVEWCLPDTLVSDVTVGNLRYELALELSDGSTIEPEAEAASADEVYASEGTFRASECVRGALVFAVPAGATASYLLHVGRLGGLRWRLD